MSKNTGLKQIERKSYMAFHQDGIWDLFVGMALLSVVIEKIYGGTGASFVVLAGAISMVPIVKKGFILPRLGYVKFSPTREAREKKNLFSLLVLLSITAALGGVVASAYTGDSAWQKWVRSLALIPMGVVMASVAAALGFLYEIRRCWIYAMLISTVFIVGHLLYWDITIQFGILGGVLFIVGLVLLIGFINKYPKSTPEENHGI